MSDKPLLHDLYYHMEDGRPVLDPIQRLRESEELSDAE